LIERQQRDCRNGRQNPDQWNIAFSDDTDERRAQYEQNEVKDMKDVQLCRVDELSSGEGVN